MDKKDIYGIIALLILIGSIYYIGNRFFQSLPSIPQSTQDKVIEQSVSTKYDTLVREYHYKPVYINKKGDTLRITDTVKVIETHPFVSSMKDTVVAGDTISAKYAFPQDNFYLTVLPRPDRYKEITKTVTVLQVKQEDRGWLIDLGTHLGAGAIGYAAGKLIK